MKNVNDYRQIEIDGYKIPYIITCEGDVYNLKTKKKLSVFYNNSGYCVVDLKVNNSPKKHFLVHRLVATAFIPNPENKLEVNHINGDKKDNRVENLEWCTRKENIKHAIDSGLRLYKNGFENHSNKFSKSTIEEICRLLATHKYKYKEVANMCGVSKTTVQDISNGKRYADIGRKYGLYEIPELERYFKLKYDLDDSEEIVNYIRDGIKSNLWVTKSGRIFNENNLCEVIPYSVKNYPYKSVAVKFANGNKQTILAHTLIAETFLENPNSYRYIIHKDGNYDNNKIDNLFYGTYRDKKVYNER